MPPRRSLQAHTHLFLTRSRLPAPPRCFLSPLLSFPPAAEKSVAEYKDKLPQNVVDSINAAVSELRGVMDSENSEEIKGKITAVQQAVMKIGESLAGKGGAEGGAAGGENVEDAEVKDKDKENK